MGVNKDMTTVVTEDKTTVVDKEELQQALVNILKIVK